jgi:glycerol kinase
VPRLVAVDAGTTGVRAIAIDEAGTVRDLAHRPLTQHYPAPGLVEHDAAEILSLVDEVLAELCGRLAADGEAVEAVGITNQRETTVAIDRDDGRILTRAIVWQDRRTADVCDALVADGHAPAIRARTGLTVDPYFSATKMRWLLEHAELDRARALGLCTIDTLVCWHLTGGARGGVYSTDPSNASRTMLYDLATGTWSDELCAVLGVPIGALAELHASCSVLGSVADSVAGGALAGVPVAAVLGDQQAALFGQRCTEPGMVKATFGTGAFLLANAGTARPPDADGLVTSVAWDLGTAGPRTFALEGASFVAGAAIQWLRDDLGLVERASDAGPLAAGVDDAAGVAFVPAFTGLGSPWWDPDARGALTGLSRGATRAHVVRAVVEALGFQARAMLEAMRAAIELREVRVDGGAAAMDLLCQLVANGAAVTVRRPRSVEATAIGAAMLAGVAVGATSLAALGHGFDEERSFAPTEDPFGDAAYASWSEAVARARRLGAQTPRATYSST